MNRVAIENTVVESLSVEQRRNTMFIYQLIKFTHSYTTSIGFFGKFRNWVVSVFGL